MAKVFGSFSRLVSLLFRKDGQDVTLRPNQATTYTAARDVQLPPGDASHVVVSEGATQTLSNKTLSSPVINTPTGITKSDVGLGNVDNTSDATKNSAAVALTNKTIDADLNTITNIENADIKAGAAIDATKIGAGSVDNTEFGYLNGVTSAIQTQLTNNATAISDHLTDTVDAHDASAISSVPSGNLAATDVQAALNELQTDVDTRATSSALTTHTGASSGVHGVTGSVVGTTDTQTLTNKTLTSPELDTPLIDDYFDINEEVAPGTPPAGKVRVYAKSDAKLYKKDDAGVEQEIGAGGGGGEINYIDNPLFDDGTVTGWAVYADAAGTTPVDGTGGSPNVTFTAVSGATVRGTYAGRLTKDAANRQGQGASYDFVIDAADTGRPVSIAFDFLASAAYVANDVGVYIYDVTNATLITPAAINVAAGKGRFSAFFVATTSTSYRLILHVASTNASAWTLDTDNFQVGPQVQLSGAAVTDWQSYTPTFGGLGTVAASSFIWRRVGDTIEVLGSATTGVPSASAVTISLPPGLAIDTAKVTSAVVGNASSNNTTTLQNTNLVVLVATLSSTTNLFVGAKGSAASENLDGAVTGNLILAGGDILRINARVPIAGWSSNTTMAERAVEEYAAYDGTSDVFGPNGALVPNVGYGTGNTSRSFTFQNVKQSTDRLIVELKSPSSTGWTVAAQLFPYVIGNNAINGNRYGVRGSWSGENVFTVDFGNQGPTVNTSALSNGDGSWADLFTAGWRWRVVRVSGGAAVGYPVGARNVVGDVTGTAVPAGLLAQRIAFTSRTVTAVTGGYTANATALATLTPGVWQIAANVSVSAGAGGSVAGFAAIVSTNNSNDSSGAVGDGNATVYPFNNTSGTQAPMLYQVVNVAVDTLIYAKAITYGANASVAIFGGAVRIG